MIIENAIQQENILLASVKEWNMGKTPKFGRTLNLYSSATWKGMRAKIIRIIID